MKCLLAGFACFAVMAGALAAPNLSLTAQPYLSGGLFTTPVLVEQGKAVTITVRAQVEGRLEAAPQAVLRVVGPHGDQVVQHALTLAHKESMAEGTWVWTSQRNGLFTLQVELDPENAINESREDDNAAELTLPILAEGMVLHFPWYRESPEARWTTCVTSANDPEQRARLAERAVKALNWAPGRVGYDEARAQADSASVLAEAEEALFRRYSGAGNEYGCGIDEVGGYPGTFRLEMSIAAMKGLIRARAERPDAFYAVWNCGGPRPELAAVCRQAADLFLLETYLWRALPEELGMQDIYECLVSRVEPFMRGTDLFQPAYGNACYTLLALDTTERPDRSDRGELENVVRFIRRRFPEMRGIGWYNGSTRMNKTEENLRILDELQTWADALCLNYWVKPCVTLMRESLWLTENDDGTTDLTLAVNNIGGMDSGEVSAEFLMDGATVGTASLGGIPAGTGRHANTVLLKQPVAPAPGFRKFEARITAAPGATVLDAAVKMERFRR